MISAGIMVEGFALLLCGLWGSGMATASYGGNIGIIGITRVESLQLYHYCYVISKEHKNICE